MKRTLLITILLSFTLGCATSKISVPSHASSAAQPIKNLALSPGAGVLAEAVGMELFNAGLTVIDANEAVQILARAGLTEIEVTSTQGFQALRDRGIDAILIVKSVDGYNGQPQSASVRITSTATGQTIAGATWQNGWGGQPGSPADRTMRKDMTAAAKEIATALLKEIRIGP